MNTYVVAAFYKFVSLPQYEDLKALFLNEMKRLDIKGTIVLAREGINGTFSGKEDQLNEFITYLRSFSEFSDLYFKISFFESNPFDKSKVKLRKEIVTMGIEDINPETDAGVYVKPEDWNNLIENEEVLTIDTRNDYEVELGTFKNAVNPHTINFRDFPDYVAKNLMSEKKRKIAMFCTGGIRCEKSTAYLKKLGFEEVYHLDGGILNYLEKIPAKESLWEGTCFVFDNRVAVDQKLSGLKEGIIDKEWKNKQRQQALEKQKLD